MRRLQTLPRTSLYLSIATAAVCFAGGLFLMRNVVRGGTTADSKWQRAAKVAPPGLVKQAIAQNYFPPPGTAPIDENAIVAAKIPLDRQGTQLYVFRFADPQLCGIQGCLFAGYLSEGNTANPVFQVLLRSHNLPPQTPLIENNSESENDLACLTVNQIVSPQLLERTRYCYDGRQFQPLSSARESLVPIADGTNPPNNQKQKP